jgi:virulence-associated protein VagC
MYVIAKVFKSGNSLVLRLPKEGEMQIEVLGNRWIVSPIRQRSWPRGFFEVVPEIRTSG